MNIFLRRVTMIHVTDQAIATFKEILSSYEQKSYHVRLQLVPGCCSGPSVKLMLDDEVYGDDETIQIDGVSFVLDPTTLYWIKGAKIDFVDSPEGKGFLVELVAREDDHSHHQCGCGGGTCGCQG